MLSFVSTALGFVALCAISVFLARVMTIPSGASPFVALCSVMVIFMLFGCLGALPLGIFVFYAFAVFAAGYCFIKRKNKCAERIMTPSFYMFILSGSVLLVFLAIRQFPMFDWDEYSLWGMAVKMTVENNTLYPAVASGFPWAVSQKPGFIVLSYFFNFGGEYFPWRTYFAYDILMISVFTTVCSFACRRKWNLAVPLFIACGVIPFINVYTRTIYLNTQYLSSYVDIPMGILMGGIFALYFSLSEKSNRLVLFAPAICIGALTLCKDTGLPLALLCAAVIFVDFAFLNKNKEFKLTRHIGGIWAKLLILFTYIMSCGVCYIVWSKYLGTLGLVSNGLGGESNMTPVQLVLNGLLMLFGLTPTASGAPFAEKFSAVFKNMLNSLVEARITLFGTGITVIGVVIILLLIAHAISANKILRRRITMFGVFGVLSFIPYYVFIGFTYVFIFKGNDGVNLIDYNRYVGCYYAALIVGAVALLSAAICGETRKTSIKSSIFMYLGLIIPVGMMAYQTFYIGRKIPQLTDAYVPIGLFIIISFVAVYGYFKNIAAPLSIIFGASVVSLFFAYVPTYLCVINAPKAVYSDIYLVENNAEKLKPTLKDGKAFYVSSGDNEGKYWFRYHYYLYPAILDYSWGGGSLHDCSLFENCSGHINVTKEQLAAYLYESENEYLVIRDADEKFIESYKELFTGDIVSGVYKIDKKDGAVIRDIVPKDGQVTRPANIIVDQNTIRVMENPESCISFSLTEEGFYE